MEKEQIERYMRGIAGLKYCDWKWLCHETEKLYEMQKQHVQFPSTAEQIESGVTILLEKTCHED